MKFTYKKDRSICMHVFINVFINVYGHVMLSKLFVWFYSPKD